MVLNALIKSDDSQLKRNSNDRTTPGSIIYPENDFDFDFDFDMDVESFKAKRLHWSAL